MNWEFFNQTNLVQLSSDGLIATVEVGKRGMARARRIQVENAISAYGDNNAANGEVNSFSMRVIKPNISWGIALDDTPFNSSEFFDNRWMMTTHDTEAFYTGGNTGSLGKGIELPIYFTDTCQIVVENKYISPLKILVYS